MKETNLSGLTDEQLEYVRMETARGLSVSAKTKKSNNSSKNKTNKERRQ